MHKYILFFRLAASLVDLFSRLATVAILACLVAPTVLADEAAIEIVLKNLNDPSGVAVRPGAENLPDELFVAVSGAGRVVRVRGDQPGIAADAIVDFAAGAGPLGLLFIDRDRLVVACEDPPVLRLYELSDQAAPLSVDAAKQQIALSPNTADAQLESGDVIDLARTRVNDKVPDALLATCPGRRLPGWPRKVPVRAGTLDESASLLAAEQNSLERALGGVAVSEQGYIVVARSAVDEDSSDSYLTFINPVDGAIVMDVPVALPRIVGLDFSPTSGNFFAVAAGGDGLRDGGVFRIDDTSRPGKPGCHATKIAGAIAPTGLAFAPDGSLYVVAAGAANNSTNERGVLLRIRLHP